jgi:hypothetical protein
MTKGQYVTAWIAGALLVAAGAAAQPPEPTQSTARPTSLDREHPSGDAEAAAPEPRVSKAGAADSEQPTMMELEAIEAELDLLVVRMNDSKGPTKIEAMADLLATLVRQHRVACGSMMRSPGETGSGGCCQGMKRPAGADTQGGADPNPGSTP